MIGLIGKKLGQTRVYDAQGNAVPVTVVHAGPNYVVQRKTKETDGYEAVQLAYGAQKEHRLSKPQAGHFARAKVPAQRRLREFRNFSLDVKAGDQVGVTLFAEGDFIDAIGITKGRGFEGVVRRHAFRGGDMTHGAKGWHRRPGAIGQRLFPGTVMRGTRMPGHMGQVRRTVQNLRVVKVLEADQLLLIQGAIPGAKGEFVLIRESKKRPKTVAAK